LLLDPIALSLAKGLNNCLDFGRPKCQADDYTMKIGVFAMGCCEGLGLIADKFEVDQMSLSEVMLFIGYVFRPFCCDLL